MPKYYIGVDSAAAATAIRAVSPKITSVSVIDRDKIALIASSALDATEQTALLSAINTLRLSIVRVKS